MDEAKYSTFRVLAELDRLPEVFGFISRFFVSRGFDDSFCKKMQIAVEEIFVNIASYAYPDDDRGDVVIECAVDDGYAVMRFRDLGIPYDPLKKDDPVIGDPKGMTIGGYGIFMVKQIMDQVEYRYDDLTKENILTMRKK
ncbi:MAG: ATP-binding protein [Lachnospiraceae bacterium]|nr:ATP-binding protein [Lachnospiraceae bacterium]